MGASPTNAPNQKGSIVDEDHWQRGAERVFDPRNRLMPASVTAVLGGPSGMGEVQQREAEVQRAQKGWALRRDA
jgi:hypothetical protein